MEEEMPWLFRNEPGAVLNLNCLIQMQDQSTWNRYSHSAFTNSWDNNLPYCTFKAVYVRSHGYSRTALLSSRGCSEGMCHPHGCKSVHLCTLDTPLGSFLQKSRWHTSGHTSCHSSPARRSHRAPLLPCRAAGPYSDHTYRQTATAFTATQMWDFVKT